MAKHSKKDDDEPKGGRPGLADRGRDGGMATRENAQSRGSAQRVTGMSAPRRRSIDAV
jgi:hypothetical protein